MKQNNISKASDNGETTLSGSESQRFYLLIVKIVPIAIGMGMGIEMR